MPFITIRKPNIYTPSYYVLTNSFSPPNITVDEVNTYYTTTHMYYIKEDITMMDIDSDKSESNKSMQISEESDKMSVDTTDSEANRVQEKLKDIYYQINSVQNSFTLNYGDIVEFPNGKMYFYHTPCIKIN